MKTNRRVPVEERIAWYCLVAIPVLVPLAVAHLPFSGGNPFALDPWVAPKIAALGILTGVGLISLAVGWARNAVEMRKVPLGWLMLAFFAIAGVATATALHPITAIFGGSTQRAGLLAFAIAGGTFVLASQLVVGKQRMLTLSRSVMIGGALVGFIGLIQSLGYDPLGIQLAVLWEIGRGTSTIGNSDWTGTYLVVPVVISGGLMLGEKQSVMRGVASACFTLATLGLLITLTRGAWLAAFVGLAVVGFAFWRSGERLPRSVLWTAGAAAILLVAVFVMKSSDILGRFADLSRGADRATGGRTVIWSESLAVIARHPLLGVGPDSFRLGWFPVRSLGSVATGASGVAEDSHNVLLLLAATIGIPGMLVAAATAIATLNSGFRSAFPAKGSSGNLVYTSWWAALLAICLSLLTSLNTVLVMALVSLALAVVLAPKTSVASVPAALRWLLAGLAVVLAVAGATVPTMSMVSNYWLAQSVSGDAVINTQRAVDAAPWDYEARRQHAFAMSAAAINALQANGAEAQTLFDTADVATKQLIAWNPYEHDSYRLRATFLTDAGAVLGAATLQSAIQVADQGLAISPASLPLRMEKVDALSQLGKWSEIVSTLKGYWNADLTLSLPGTAYAEALMRTGDRAQAAQVLADVKARFPNDPTVAADITRIQAIQPSDK